MCGIGGILGGGLRADERESLALRLRGALAHRGPDDADIFSTNDATLVHTRLAILDPTGAGRQPMRRGPLILTFNGEIYDFRERRRELAREGIRFETDTDTEVLLALYARHGEACVPELRGMFACAVWDERDASCLLARDPFGIKPLYHAAFGRGGLVFASELRAILATGLVPRAIDSAGLDGFLATGSVPEPRTMIVGIKCLPAGHSLRWNTRETTLRRYFDLHFAGKADELAESAGIRPALADAVDRHLVSDVPIGILLSGGLDSSALLALSKSAGRDDIATFSLGVEDAALDETAPARAIARHFGARHHEMLLTQELARHWIGDFLDAADQPTIDGFNTYCACKLAADHSCKVVLSGLGADELFGGYPSFQHVPRLLRASRGLRGIPARTAARSLARMNAGPRVARACDYLAGPSTVARAYAAFRGVFTEFEIARLRQALFPGLPSGSGTDDTAEEELVDLSDEISRLELNRYLRNQLLRDADVMSMVHGVELRVPLLDLPLFSQLRSIPAARRLDAQKRLLRDAVPELPLELLAPRKRAFGLPFASWLENEWTDLTGELPRCPRLALAPWYRRWSLIVLQHWLKRHHVVAG
jgi:asparagine synthase (glutamine-hydrolysing)